MNIPTPSLKSCVPPWWTGSCTCCGSVSVSKAERQPEPGRWKWVSHVKDIAYSQLSSFPAFAQEMSTTSNCFKCVVAILQVSLQYQQKATPMIPTCTLWLGEESISVDTTKLGMSPLHPTQSVEETVLQHCGTVKMIHSQQSCANGASETGRAKYTQQRLSQSTHSVKWVLFSCAETPKTNSGMHHNCTTQEWMLPWCSKSMKIFFKFGDKHCNLLHKEKTEDWSLKWIKVEYNIVVHNSKPEMLFACSSKG